MEGIKERYREFSNDMKWKIKRNRVRVGEGQKMRRVSESSNESKKMSWSKVNSSRMVKEQFIDLSRMGMTLEFPESRK